MEEQTDQQQTHSKITNHTNSKDKQETNNTTLLSPIVRYDDGLQNVANGFTDLIRDEEVLEQLEKPVGTALGALFRGKVVGSNPAGPTKAPFPGAGRAVHYRVPAKNWILGSTRHKN
jgi:hypothetical protein